MTDIAELAREAVVAERKAAIAYIEKRAEKLGGSNKVALSVVAQDLRAELHIEDSQNV